MGPVGPRTVFTITTAGDRIRESGWEAEIVPDCWLLSCVYFPGFTKFMDSRMGVLLKSLNDSCYCLNKLLNSIWIFVYFARSSSGSVGEFVKAPRYPSVSPSLLRLRSRKSTSAKIISM